MNIFTVAFFGHRRIEGFYGIEEIFDSCIRNLLKEKEYVDFLVGENGDFDMFATLEYICLFNLRKPCVLENFSCLE